MRARMGRMSSIVGGWKFQRLPPAPVCFVGDLHGLTDKAKALWGNLGNAAGKSFDQATVVFLGDYCDRGPDTRGTIDWLIELKDRHPEQKHVFLMGNHDFALCAFLGLLPGSEAGSDYSDTWRTQYRPKVRGEELYTGPAHDTMHLQGVRWAADGFCVFDSNATFESYGVEFGNRQGLLDAMPDSHLDFFSNLCWIAKFRSNIGDIVAVHAGFEDQSPVEIDQMATQLARKDPALLQQAFIEPISGRANVERMPAALLAPVLPKRGYLPPPLFLVSGHHGFVRLNGRRFVVDMCSGRLDKDLAALVLKRDGAGDSHTQITSDNGLDVQIITS